MKAVLMKAAWVLSQFGGRFAGDWRGLVVAAFAFACGAALVSAPEGAPRAKHAAPPAVSAEPCEAAPPNAPAEPAPACEEVEEWGPPALEEWKNRHNGTPLPTGYDPARHLAKLSESKVIVLPSGRTLSAVGNMLYMHDSGRRSVWTYDTSQQIFDFAYVAATEMVYATSYDNIMLILDARTGRELHAESRNGRAGYGRVLPYGADACLVADSFGGYRADYEGGYEPTQDGVAAWRGTKMLWRVAVPPDAELQVVGSRIYAVTKTRSRILVREIKAPKGAR
jgi:hypothetical protein